MALSRNRLVAYTQMLAAFVQQKRAQDCHRRLARRWALAMSRGPAVPRTAWLVYVESMRDKSWLTNGWLVEFGVYDFSGANAFHFDLVRQFATLETWNDEYLQLRLELRHPVTPDLVALGQRHQWSNRAGSLDVKQLEGQPDLGALLASASTQWVAEITLKET